MKRRNFLKTSGAVVAGSMLLNPSGAIAANIAGKKKRLALVGTGVRGISFWGRDIVEGFGDIVEYVGLCDINPGRLAYGKSFMGVDCPVFTNFDEMMVKTKPDMLIVTTVDANHHEFIIKGLEYGAEVLTEKPLTTDEVKCQAILDAEKKYNKKVTVGFNYRYNPHYTKLRELLSEKRIGKITSVDFHWYLNVYHGASYFRRWHGIREHGGTLLIHKASHHFDLLNWWIGSDPVEVSAYGMLEHYGKNNTFRGTKCRGCEHKEKCRFFWDITGNDHLMKLYVENEKHDGYIRDNCVWSNKIDIYDKMSVQIKYANNVQVNYSLTTYSPYEGMTIAFNGMNGRIDSWDGIPWRKQEKLEQAELHAKEMAQDKETQPAEYEEIYVSDNFGETNLLKVPRERGGHGGGDKRLHDRIFRNPDSPDPHGHFAGSRDGAMSILIGTAARKSIDEERPVKIADLTDLVPHPTRQK